MFLGDPESESEWEEEPRRGPRFEEFARAIKTLAKTTPIECYASWSYHLMGFLTKWQRIYSGDCSLVLGQGMREAAIVFEVSLCTRVEESSASTQTEHTPTTSAATMQTDGANTHHQHGHGCAADTPGVYVRGSLRPDAAGAKEESPQPGDNTDRKAEAAGITGREGRPSDATEVDEEAAGSATGSEGGTTKSSTEGAGGTKGGKESTCTESSATGEPRNTPASTRWNTAIASSARHEGEATDHTGSSHARGPP